jgi:hypothetical protein
MHFLCSFRPLAESEHGRKAIASFGLPPFVDASCRREPDFESQFPSITALCRCGSYAPRLGVGDSIVYITKKAQYPGIEEPHSRLVAILKVVATFQSHSSAADWYRARQLPVPSNCIVFGNPPLPLEKTDRFYEDLNRWDAIYRLRAKTWGIFHVCEPLFRELHHPPAINKETMAGIFGCIPETRIPPSIPHQAYAEIQRVAQTGRSSD